MLWCNTFLRGRMMWNVYCCKNELMLKQSTHFTCYSCRWSWGPNVCISGYKLNKRCRFNVTSTPLTRSVVNENFRRLLSGTDATTFSVLLRHPGDARHGQLSVWQTRGNKRSVSRTRGHLALGVRVLDSSHLRLCVLRLQVGRVGLGWIDPSHLCSKRYDRAMTLLCLAVSFTVIPTPKVLDTGSLRNQVSNLCFSPTAAFVMNLFTLPVQC